MAARDFTLDDVESAYVGSDSRYVVSLIVGFSEKELTIDSPDPRLEPMEAAASAVLQMTRNEEKTRWHVHDRQTGQTRLLLQEKFDIDLLL